MSEQLIGRSSAARITEGSTVTLHFSLLTVDGQEIDTTRNGKAARFTVGDGSLLPGFEAVLLGQQAGFTEQVRLAPADAFGDHNPANVRQFERRRFEQLQGLAADAGIEPGLVISFASPEGELPGVVTAIAPASITVDFNHPLSGQTIIFDVAVIRVDPA